MSQHLYSSYISPLDSLVFNSVTDQNKPSDMETEANLALWTNAQFTYDIQPGSGILDDTIELSPNLSTATGSSSPSTKNTVMNSPTDITYENLANYLDYELPQQQQQQQHKIEHSIQPKAPSPPMLLPKILPAMTVEEITKALLSTTMINNNRTATHKSSSPTPMEITKLSEKGPVEEDKRRRNTAASARFRVKKKQREQTMEKTVREMTEKSAGLESRVKELELEIKWLRGLLIEKGTPAPSGNKDEATPIKKESL